MTHVSFSCDICKASRDSSLIDSPDDVPATLASCTPEPALKNRQDTVLALPFLALKALLLSSSRGKGTLELAGTDIVLYPTSPRIIPGR